ncbi:MAG: hypothetical protein M0P69_20535 [Bacteroidales bacterium]|nr:hypothetical protein [Bacteroidales bacterium]
MPEVNYKSKYWAKRPFDYNGKTLSRGQVFKLTGCRNDEKLVGLNYVGEVPKGATLYACRYCGAEFVGEGERDKHGRDRHSGRVLTPMEEDMRDEQEDRFLSEVAPLGAEAAQVQEAG